jgi:predicted outer membrane protein
MKDLRSMLFFTLLTFSGLPLFSQNPPPAGSAKAAAVSDAQFIAENIEYNEDIMFLAQKAVERTEDERLKELAQRMVEDHSAMLYSMEHLKTAGTGTSGSVSHRDNTKRPGTIVNSKLSMTPVQDYDSVWVASLLDLQQAKYDQYTLAKETVTNPQLKMAINDAMPLLRKHLTQLKSVQKYLIRLGVQERKEAARKAKEQEEN